MSEDKNTRDFDIPIELYNAIEAFCKKNDMSVTQFVEEAITRGLEDPSTLKPVFS